MDKKYVEGMSMCNIDGEWLEPLHCSPANFTVGCDFEVDGFCTQFDANCDFRVELTDSDAISLNK